MEEWKCKLNPCEIRLERLKNRNLLSGNKILTNHILWVQEDLEIAVTRTPLLNFFITLSDVKLRYLAIQVVECASWKTALN